MTAACLVVLPAATTRLAAFDPVKDVEIRVERSLLSLTLPKGVHLKRRFLKLELHSPGRVTLGALPESSERDETDEPIWHGRIEIPVTAAGLEDPVQLTVTYQPCSEGPNGVCYRPQRQKLTLKAADFQP